MIAANIQVVVVIQVFLTSATSWMVTEVLIASMSPMLAAPTLASMELRATTSGLPSAVIVPSVSWVHSARDSFNGDPIPCFNWGACNGLLDDFCSCPPGS